MQDLIATPLCQISHPEDIVATHKRYFNTYLCPKCRKVLGFCTCKNPDQLKPKGRLPYQGERE